jgi:hypothetical protein
LKLEELAAGEQASAEIHPHLESCDGCREYVRALQLEQEAFRRSRPAERFVLKLDRRSVAAARSRFGWLGLLGGAATALLVVLALPWILSDSDPGDLLLKGSPFTAVYMREGMVSPQQVTSDQRLMRGDAVRFFFRSSSEGFLAIVDLDARGAPTVLFPYGGKELARVEPNAAEALPRSIVLDDAPGPEHFIAVFSRTPRELGPVLRELERQAGQPSVHVECEGCEVHVLRVQKGP